MGQINCPNCGSDYAMEYFYYMNCNNCGYEEVFEEGIEKEEDF